MGRRFEIDDGKGTLETAKEKVFRLKWEKLIAPTVIRLGPGL